MKFIYSNSIKPTQLVAIFTLVLALIMVGFTNSNDAQKTEMVVLSTEFGDMTILLYDETPLHKANFLKLVKEGFFDDLLFHRVIEGFMVQGGDPESRGAAAGTGLGKGGPGYTVPAEFNTQFIHKKGALSAARQGDAMNPKKESSGSQFYVVQGKPTSGVKRKSATTALYTAEQVATYAELGGTPFLDDDYTVFGEVVEGLDVIDSIAAQPVDRMNRPLKDVKMTMKIEKKKWK